MPPLSDDVLHQIVELIPKPTMSKLITISQVNRQFRRVCLSDSIWAKFDVYHVRDSSTKPLYEYAEYNLRGIAAGFLIYLVETSHKKRKWYFKNDYFDGGLMQLRTDLYTQIHALCNIQYESAATAHDSNYPMDTISLIKLDVWKLWSTHLIELKDWKAQVYPLIPQEVLKDKNVYLELIKVVDLPLIEPVFKDDWDVNMAMVLYGGEFGEIVESTFEKSREFVLEALWWLKHLPNSAMIGNIEVLCDGFCHDKEVMITAVVLHIVDVASWPTDLFNDRDFCLAGLNAGTLSLTDLPEPLLRDRRNCIGIGTSA